MPQRSLRCTTTALRQGTSGYIGRLWGSDVQRTHTRKPRQNGASSMARDGIVAQQTRVVLWCGRGVHRRHDDFQFADIASNIGTHVHQMTSNDVVTWLRAFELCHCVTPVYATPRTFEAHEG